MSSSSSDAGPNYSNPETREKLIEARKEVERRKSEGRMSAEEASETKEWLQQTLAEQSTPVEIFDREFLFSPMGTTTVMDIVERGRKLDEEEDIGANSDLFQDVIDLLARHCQDPGMDSDAFGQIPPATLQDVFEDVVTNTSEVDPERIEKFRQQ